jgi:Tol biopolymer transport system component
MKKWFAACAVVVSAAVAVGVMALAGATQEGVPAGGLQANAESFGRISGDGRFVVFWSKASNLVAGDTNGSEDVFLRDLRTGKTERVSVSRAGREGNGDSSFPHVSADGRFVCFMSRASNLVPGDTNAAFEVLLRDRQKGTTERVSLTSTGAQVNGSSAGGSVTDDGRCIVFWSSAADLAPGSGRNATFSVFVRDREKGTTECVSINSAGQPANRDCNFATLSSDGRFVTFASDATDLAPGPNAASIEMFLHDRLKHTTERISGGIASLQGPGLKCVGAQVSADGRSVYFVRVSNMSLAAPLLGRSELFVRDRQQGSVERLLPPEPWGRWDLTPDGRFLALEVHPTSSEDNQPWSQIFLLDRKTNKRELISASTIGKPSHGSSQIPSLSADGRFVCFSSPASDLVPGDTNGCKDVFVRDRLLGVTTRVSVSSAPPK